MPRVPLSLLAWCAAVGEAVWRRHRACVALALLLDCEARRWVSPPLIPHQRCGRRRVTWSLEGPDSAGLPARLRAGGSFQCLPPGDPFSVHRAVPRFGGVHAVAQRPGRHRPSGGTLFFLRTDATGDAALADPAGTTGDDVDAALREAAGRLVID
ncbi:MAG TPA: hypothetical protein VEA69_15000 [Tepidisphaeraceae bacterium]|nr:hypothetical protein [Tepidisphaeraceae bacterium]